MHLTEEQHRLVEAAHGKYAVTLDSGYLILTRLGPLRRWWRRCLHALWQGLGLVHPIDEPL
jgi:hypothetical protein